MSVDQAPPLTEARRQALQVLCLVEPAAKAAAARALYEQTLAGLPLDPDAQLPRPEGVPGRPAAPRLVSAIEVPPRSPFTPTGRAALLHAIAHIEFNAINLALDAVWRFPGMPREFYLDWLRVASEEALHYTLLAGHLQSLGYCYGDFDAHDGLWAMAERTAGDALARMALVPRTLEARGLDATPPIQAKLRRAGDLRAVEILDVILRDEIGHVEIGNRWYRHLCRAQGLDAVAIYPGLVQRYDAPRQKPPYNLAARAAAGFSAEELAYLQSCSLVAPHLRIARPVLDLERSQRMYCAGLGLRLLGSFADHQGFDGLLLGLPGAAYHFEFTRCRHHPVRPQPTPEDLAVFYLPERAPFEQRCAALLAAGFQCVASFNPYWDVKGRSFEDADGYRVVIQQAAWTHAAV